MKYERDKVKAWAGDNQWKALQADLARFHVHGFSGWATEGFWALAIFRFQKIASKGKPRWLWLPARIVLAVVKKLFTLITHISIDVGAEIGPGMLIPHVGPIRIHEDTRMGADCAVHHVCTIGADSQGNSGAIIGDHVFISCHSSIIGKVVIGDGAMIAANSLVITNVPAGATAIGVPAKILPAIWKSTASAPSQAVAAAAQHAPVTQ